MKKSILVVVFVFMFVSTVFAFGIDGWEHATNTGSESTGDIFLTRCNYQTLMGYQFSIIVRNSICPFSIEVNPETGQWRK